MVLEPMQTIMLTFNDYKKQFNDLSDEEDDIFDDEESFKKSAVADIASSSCSKPPDKEEIVTTNHQNPFQMVTTPTDHHDYQFICQFLKENNFNSNVATLLAGYSKLQLAQISKIELKKLLGVQDGIRLYNRIKKHQHLWIKPALGVSKSKSVEMQEEEEEEAVKQEEEEEEIVKEEEEEVVRSIKSIT